MKTSVPWPLNDRDAALEFKITIDTEEYFEATMNSVPGIIPEKKDIVRIRKAKGKWIFKKNDRYNLSILWRPGRKYSNIRYQPVYCKRAL